MCVESDDRMNGTSLRPFAPQFRVFEFMEHANDMGRFSRSELVSVCEC